jgi:hypothetical protein
LLTELILDPQPVLNSRFAHPSGLADIPMAAHSSMLNISFPIQNSLINTINSFIGRRQRARSLDRHT